jgi:hypothetical protein
MLTDSAQVSVPLGATVNVFQGRPIEFIGAPSVARLLIVSEETGCTMSWTINVGGIQHVPIAAGSSINLAQPGSGAGPREDEDVVATNVPMPAGSRNALEVTNPATNSAAAIIRYRANILP